MRVATPVYHQFLERGTLSLCTGRCIRSGRKPRVLLDGENLFGKLHFSLWRPCHKSFLRKSFTTSTSLSVKRLSSTASSCAAIPRKNCARTSKSPHWFSLNGTRKRSVSRSCATSSLVWWNTAGTSWRFSILWWDRTFTTTACSKRPAKSNLGLAFADFFSALLPHQALSEDPVPKFRSKIVRQPSANFTILTGIGGQVPQNAGDSSVDGQLVRG